MQHVATVSYAVCKFLLGDNLITEVTYTQVLQTFHRVKPHQETPLKLNRESSAKSSKINFDPRKQQDRDPEHVTSNIRNMAISYQVTGNQWRLNANYAAFPSCKPPCSSHGSRLYGDYQKIFY
ncbi:uncharacterized protein LOC141905029 [Tubulanus polymorphus]|uniref:uncharacterized protein LOC141905029 n=1 Tax=Tubulanus polymorphus TaxID=672921 RepID=UPI003DA1DC67